MSYHGHFYAIIQSDNRAAAALRVTSHRSKRFSHLSDFNRGLDDGLSGSETDGLMIREASGGRQVEF